jgi:DNA polymerase-3 subunit gamma/tau
VHELDAASNNGVEAMRDLIEKASLGTPGRHKVYILDEVHMLSKGAEAALLKTLEEPPPHVVFVLATTDPQKVSDTIRSRTQHLQFHLLTADLLAEHVRWIVGDAGLAVDDDAIDDVLALGGGSARDTLSALELVASSGGGRVESITLDEFVVAMIEREPGRALTMVAHAISLGRDPRTLTEELIGFLRNGFLSLMAPELVQLPSDRVDVVADLARRLGAPGLVRGIEVLGASLVEMRQAPDPRVLLDVAVVQLTSDAVAVDVTALLTRLDRLEQRVAETAVPPSAPAPSAAAGSSAGVDDPAPAKGRAALGGRARQRPAPEGPTTNVGEGPAVGGAQTTTGQAVSADDDAPTTRRVTRDDWENTIRPQLRGMARAVYAPADYVSSTDTTVVLSLPNAVHRKKCEEQRSTVEEALSGHAGTPVAIELVAGGDDGGGDQGGSSSSSSGSVSPSGASSDSGSVGASPTTPTDASALDRDGAGGDPDDEIDLDDLVEAPPESVKTPIDRLAEAFPGSQLIDESA